jgi:hypothetical protein
MATYSNQEYVDIHFMYGYCDGNARASVREYHRRFPARRIPNPKVFINVHRHLTETGNFPKATAERPVQQELANEEAILNMIENSPSTSVRRISKRVRVSRMRVWRTLHNFGLYPYHIQSVQNLQPADYPARVAFCRWLIGHQQLCGQILFTDEATFTRDGITNNRNSHSWALENPFETTETHFQHRFSVNIWCGVLNNLLIGPFAFQERLTSEHYLNFLQNELPGLMEDVPLQNRVNMWFQHDGAPPHFGINVRTYLNNNFANRWIGRGGPVIWPPRSPDLTPLDYYLWGHMKSLVYSNKPQTRDELIQNIMAAAASIRDDPDTLQRATSSIIRRARMCCEAAGGHFEPNLS